MILSKNLSLALVICIFHALACQHHPTASSTTKVLSSLPYLDATTIVVSQNGAQTLFNQQPANGILYQLDDKKDTLLLVAYRNGREDGWAYGFYPNHQRKEARFYKNGQKEGVHQGWYPNGRLAFEYHFQNDEFDGTMKEWTAEGIAFREMNFVKGQEEGMQTIRYSNGKIKSNYYMRDGVRFGLLGTRNCENVSKDVFK